MNIKRIFFSPFLVIVGVWFLFAFPYFLQGKTPFPSSYQVNFFSPWNAYSEFASPYKNGATPDVVGQIFPWREFTITSWKSGSVPLWNPYSFSGTYHLANYQSAVFSPMNLGFFIFPFVDWWGFMVLLQPLFAGIFMMLFAKSLKFSKSSQIISSLSFMFCGFIVTWMMYATLGYAILFLPLALSSIEKYLHTKKNVYLLLLYLTVPLSFFSGHFQISIYFLLFVVYYASFRFLYRKRTNFFPIFASILLGVITSSIQLLPSIEAYSQSLRSGIFQKTEAIPWSYLPTFLAPDFFGNPVTRNSWFGHYAEWNGFIGIIPLFFAVYALFSIKKKEVVIFAVPLLLSLLLAFASPVLDVLVALKIPVLSTSAASRIIIIYSFSASVLAGYGFYFFVNDVKSKAYKRVVYLAVGFAGIFCILWGIILSKLFLEIDKIQIASSNLRLPTMIFIVFMGLICFVVFIKKKHVLALFLTLITLLFIFDSLRFALKWQPFDPKNLVFAQTPVAKFYSKLNGDERIYMNSGAEGIMHYKMQGIEGYDAVYINRYGSFIASIKDGKLKTGFRSVVEFPKESPYATQAANFLGIRYIVHKVSDGQNVWEFPFWKYPPGSLKLIYDDKKFEILENLNVFPRAFLVQEVVNISDPQKILNKMFTEETNLLQTAIVEHPTDLNFGNNLSSGSAKIIAYKPNSVRIKTKSMKNSFLVLTDSYSDGWNVYVNNVKSRVYRTDFAFRGVFVPPGDNDVEFKYEPKSYTYGFFASSVGVFGMIILLILLKKVRI